MLHMKIIWTGAVELHTITKSTIKGVQTTFAFYVWRQNVRSPGQSLGEHQNWNMLFVCTFKM